MKTIRQWALAVGMVGLLAGTTLAGDVTVKGVHLCCGACVRDANAALKGVTGVSQVGANRDAKIVSFKAADEEAAKAGIKALAEAGFHGDATHGDDELAFPASGAKEGETAPMVTLTGVHLCCGACVRGAQEALDDVKGIDEILIDRKGRKVTAKGKDLDVSKVVEALNAGGFHGTVKK